VSPRNGAYQVELKVTVSVEGADRPAAVAGVVFLVT